MSWQCHMFTDRFNCNGEKYQVEDVAIEFTGEGRVLQVEIFNVFFEDWFPVDFSKMLEIDQNKIQLFVLDELVKIKADLAKKSFENDDMVPA